MQGDPVLDVEVAVAVERDAVGARVHVVALVEPAELQTAVAVIRGQALVPSEEKGQALAMGIDLSSRQVKCNSSL